MSFFSKIERTQIYLRGVQELRIVGDVCWWVSGVVIVYRAPEGTHPTPSDDDLRAPLPREYNPLFLRGTSCVELHRGNVGAVPRLGA